MAFDNPFSPCNAYLQDSRTHVLLLSRGRCHFLLTIELEVRRGSTTCGLGWGEDIVDTREARETRRSNFAWGSLLHEILVELAATGSGGSEL